jgi:hypothetical protein
LEELGTREQIISDQQKAAHIQVGGKPGY